MRRILLIDDHDDARKEMEKIVRRAFGDVDVKDVATLAQARRLILADSFDLVVLDLDLPDGRGEDFLAEILQQNPNIYVVISTIHDESDRLLKALQGGAKGYLLKEQTSDQLVSEFQGISRGKPALAPTVTRRLLEFMRASHSPETAPDFSAPKDSATDAEPAQSEAGPEVGADLTKRESEVLVLLSKGFNRPEIAGILGISKHTVATHVDKVYRKLDVSSRGEAAVIAERLNLL